jgi:hypothetical protein
MLASWQDRGFEGRRQVNEATVRVNNDDARVTSRICLGDHQRLLTGIDHGLSNLLPATSPPPRRR